MGSVHFNKLSKRWRVQIIHRGFKSISMHFDTKEEAEKWLKKMDKIMQRKIQERKNIEVLRKILD